MASLRLCSHIKTNGIKCGSPALRHHTMCYFHYQWQRRDQRRIRLGGPVGMNKNSGIELPLLDGPEAILISIMEIQHALLDQRIPIKMGTALLYSLQLALQAKIPYSGLCAREPVRECPELEMELELERAKAQRPSKEKCSRCPKQETCLSPSGCKKLPKLPTGYRREGDHLVRDTEAPATVPADALTFCHAEDPEPVEGDEASLSTPQTSTSEAVRSLVPPIEGPASRSSDPPIVRSSDAAQLAAPYSHNILGFNPNALIDLPGKFPQLVDTTQPENQGVGVIANESSC